MTKPIGTVESAAPGCGGFHVKLHELSQMPKVGTLLYTTPPKREFLTDTLQEAALIAAGREANDRQIRTTDAYAIIAAYLAALEV